MIIVEYKKEEDATWDDDHLQWRSSFPPLERLLNSTLPDDIHGVFVPFLKGGPGKYAFNAAKKSLGDDLQMVQESTYTPPDEEDVVY